MLTLGVLGVKFTVWYLEKRQKWYCWVWLAVSWAWSIAGLARLLQAFSQWMGE